MVKKYTGDLITKLAQTLLGVQGNAQEQAARRYGIDPIYNADKSGTVGYNWGTKNPTPEDIAGIEKLQNKIEGIQDISEGVSLPQLGQLGLGAIKEHPFKAAGLGLLGAGNIGGLTDNDKFGGQLGGLALGGLGAATLASGNPYLQAMLTMGGGQLGALFDKLRARKEQEQAQVQQYGGR